MGHLFVSTSNNFDWRITDIINSNTTTYNTVHKRIINNHSTLKSCGQAQYTQDNSWSSSCITKVLNSQPSLPSTDCDHAAQIHTGRDGRVAEMRVKLVYWSQEEQCICSLPRHFISKMWSTRRMKPTGQGSPAKWPRCSSGAQTQKNPSNQQQIVLLMNYLQRERAAGFTL